jgi:hypothetical protein
MERSIDVWLTEISFLRAIFMMNSFYDIGWIIRDFKINAKLQKSKHFKSFDR